MATTATPARRVNLNTATARTVQSIIGRETTVQLWAGKRTGKVERIDGGRAIVRFPGGGWAYSGTQITVR